MSKNEITNENKYKLPAIDYKWETGTPDNLLAVSQDALEFIDEDWLTLIDDMALETISYRLTHDSIVGEWLDYKFKSFTPEEIQSSLDQGLVKKLSDDSPANHWQVESYIGRSYMVERDKVGSLMDSLDYAFMFELEEYIINKLIDNGKYEKIMQEFVDREFKFISSETIQELLDLKFIKRITKKN